MFFWENYIFFSPEEEEILYYIKYPPMGSVKNPHFSCIIYIHKTLKTPNTRLYVFNNLTTFKEWTVQSCTSCTGKWETAWMHRNEAILTFCKKQNKIFIRAANEHVLTNKDSVQSNCKDAQYGLVTQKEWTSFFKNISCVYEGFLGSFRHRYQYWEMPLKLPEMLDQ